MADWLDQLACTLDSGFWEESRVVCFRSESYPGWFLSAWRTAIKRELGLSVASLQHDGKRLPSELVQRSFFADQSIYWLGEVGSPLLKHLSSYDSSRSVAFFVSSTSSCKIPPRATVVVLPIITTSVMLRRLLKMLFIDLSEDRLSVMGKILPLKTDDILLAVDHVVLLRSGLLSSFPGYSAMIFRDEVKLYHLSDAFLAKDSRRFYKLWDRISMSYELPFWTMFFGRLLWKVSCFLDGGTSYRGLPRSFVGGGSKKYSVSDVADRISAVHELDVAFKNGLSTGCFEGFLARHFG